MSETTTTTTAPRKLSLESEQDVIDEVARLRRGYRQAGNWNLAQVCWHVGLPVEKFLAPPVPMDLAPTPEQAAKKAGFVDYIVAHRAPPPGVREAPPSFVPSATLTPAEVDRYVESLKRMAAYPHPKVMMGPIGPVTIAEFRACNVFHAAHHLAFLVPVERRALKYSTLEDVKADVRKLRAGYKQLGNWTLGQVAWHLNKAFEFQLASPVAEASEEQRQARPMMERAMAMGALPAGIRSPDAMVPPGDAGEADVEGLIAVLDRVTAHNGGAQHRRFGPLNADEFRKLSLLHCAHHLSYLVPNDG